ncbi:hypothetical protein M2165_000151 [Variovorax sp. TBS-050B]|uniref:hypothetical protein n=1 Tax=Variovorax sp. TBS-050B TaxID=2940551 RepID=UPI00247578FD|nr:hypothetical protein [Variovorax sp. TBS-050B]MDH6590262.1 hypothetical protein [Variovorax sp. TBS-050B]
MQSLQRAASDNIEGFSAVLRAAELSHHIERVQHELNTDDEFISYFAETERSPKDGPFHTVDAELNDRFGAKRTST